MEYAREIAGRLRASSRRRLWPKRLAGPCQASDELASIDAERSTRVPDEHRTAAASTVTPPWCRRRSRVDAGRI